MRGSVSFLDVSVRKYVVTRKKVHLNHSMNAKMTMSDVTTAYVAETAPGGLRAQNQDWTKNQQVVNNRL